MPRYLVVDVFTDKALEGNPLAVFPDSAGLSGEIMQKIARELNLSETVFIVPATKTEFAARLRIFTPLRELPFAGHPTVGASFVLLRESIVPKDRRAFILEEGVGPVPIRIELSEAGERPLIWLTNPPIRFGRTYEREAWAHALGLSASDLLDIAPQLVTAGNPNVYIGLRTKEAVDRAVLNASALGAIRGGERDPGCIFVFTPVEGGAYSRMFAPELGVPEDPATGSATGPLAAYMMQHKLAPSADGTGLVSEQGVKMGRRSLLHIRVHGEGGAAGIEVGGYVTPIIEAVMTL